MADGQVSGRGDPNGDTTTLTYYALGRATAKETKTGATSRAAYTWTRNQADQVLREQSTIATDGPPNGLIARCVIARSHASHPLGLGAALARQEGEASRPWSWWC